MTYKYTSKERDKESGYDYFGARYYDARVGRWGVIDPLLEKEPSITPYHYVSNNPINKIDPHGLDDVYYKNGVEVDRDESHGFWETLGRWFTGDTYYVQNESGNIEFKGNNYYEALSFETVNQFKEWDYVYSDWQTSSAKDAYSYRMNEAISGAPKNVIDAYFYVLSEANKGKLDQKLNLTSTTIYIYNNIAMNYQEAGNLIFGSAIREIEINLKVANFGGEVFSLIKNKRPDEYNEVQAYKIGYYNFNSKSSFFKNRALEKYR